MSPSDDPIYREMLPEFIASWKYDAGQPLSDIIHARDAGALYRFGHTLVGSGLQFGVESFASIGRAFEQCSKADDWNGADCTRSDLLREISVMEDSLRMPRSS